MTKIMTLADEIYERNFKEFDTTIYTDGDKEVRQACINAINEALSYNIKTQ